MPLLDGEINIVASNKRKLETAAAKVKSIVEKGRTVAITPANLFIFKGMYKELKPAYDEFKSTYDNICDFYISKNMPGFPIQSDKDLARATEERLYEAHAIYEEHMNPTPTRQTVLDTTINGSTSNISKGRLPDLKCPVFTGKPGDWPLFRDTFQSMFHDDDSVLPMEKYLYLISFLSGYALSQIKGIPVIEANYVRASETLKAYYNNKRVIASSYLKSLFNYAPPSGKSKLASLQQFIREVADNISAYQELKIKDSEDFILFSLAIRCLDSDLRQRYERTVSDTDYPKFKDLMLFLWTEAKTLELTSPESSNALTLPSQLKEPKKTSNKALLGLNQTVSQPINKCHVCNANHTLYNCSKFRKASPADRFKLINAWQGCKNCLSPKHRTKQSTSKESCYFCGARHHTWLHLAKTNTPSSQTTQTSSSSPQQVSSTPTASSEVIQEVPLASCSSITNRSRATLGTAIVQLQDFHGKWHNVRAVLDTGSEVSLITHDCALRLGLPIQESDQSLSGIGQHPVDTHGVVSCTLKSTIPSSMMSYSTSAIVLSSITYNLPHHNFSIKDRNLYNKYVLADPEFWQSSPIQFVIAADIFFDVLSGEPVSVGENKPKLTPTTLGYIVAGRSCLPATQKTKVNTLLTTHSNESLSVIMNKFWEIESIPTGKPIMSLDDKVCEEHFQQTCYQLPNGRSVSSLPFKKDPSKLGDSRRKALSRFHNLENKLSKNSELRELYNDFINSYLDLGHMSPSEGPVSYLIPHHCIYKEEDKFRVVFDASSSTSTGSLNDYLHAGPKLQLDITDIVLNFRLYPVVFTADIVKMYRQILCSEEDSEYLRILWRFDPSNEVCEYKLNTVTYGVKSAPYQALRVLRKLAEDYKDIHPEAARVLMEEAYVDDICTGAASVEDALLLQNQLISLLSSGCFELSKWSSNRPELLANVTETSCLSTCDFAPMDDHTIKILGLHWTATSDCFSYAIKSPELLFTKRSILSVIARIYDPLGYLAPVVIFAKIILQESWLAKVDWDEIVPSDIATKCKSFLRDLSALSQVNC